MYGVVLMAALASGTQVAGGHGWYGYNGCGCGYGYGNGYGWNVGLCLGPCLPTGPHSGGRFWLGLFDGWQVGTTLSAEEEKAWADYVGRLEGQDKENMERVWQTSDPASKQKLLNRLAEMEKKWGSKEADKPAPEEAPLSAAELNKWDAYLKALDGEKKKEAEEKWAKADLAGKREMLKTLTE
jgi:hypothetical protein